MAEARDGKRRRRFRIAAPLLMLIAAIVLVVQEPVLLVQTRNHIFDQFNRWQPRPSGPSLVTVVAVDDDSLERTGLQWPWPRDVMARMVDKLSEAGARVIAFDVVFAEQDRTSPRASLARLLDQDELDLDSLDESKRQAAATLLDGNREHDQLLADAIQRAQAKSSITNVVLGEFTSRKVSRERLPANAGFNLSGENMRRWLASFPGVVGNRPALHRQAFGHGSLSILTEGDQIHRRIPAMILAQGDPHPTLFAEAIRAFENVGAFNAGPLPEAAGDTAAGFGLVTIGRQSFPVDAYANLQLWYRPFIEMQTIPAWRLLQDGAGEPSLTGQIVLIGANATGLGDRKFTPLGEIVGGVYVHATAIEQALDGSFLKRPDWLHGAELALMIVFGLLVLGVTVSLGGFFGAVIAIIVVAAPLGLSWYAYSEQQLLLDSLRPLLVALLTGFVGALSR